MLYHLLAPLARQHILFNLFNYITFRAAGATVTALLLAFVLGPWIIRKLREHNIGQVVRAEGPASHQGKRGTPTMGGIIIILGTLVPTLLWARLDSRVRPDSTQLPLLKYILLPLPGLLYVAFVTTVIAGSTNAVNLTDGLDGLATGLTAIAASAFAVFAYLFGRVDAARYLGVLHLAGAGELAIFCGALMGASLGFLWFNAHPAQVFMGDTGALAIGGALGTVAILLKAEFLLLIAGGVFAAETVSVMVQTTVYRWHKKRRGKEYADAHRVFRMAPLHHHFEKLGWAEPQVVMRFYILGALCAMLALATLKVR